MTTMRLLCVFMVFLGHELVAQNCAAPPTGLVPINDLGTGTFSGLTGGLYPNGSNVMPTAHRQAGLMMASQVQCLDTAGNPDANGKIVWLSIGMSNTTQETQQFIPLANIHPAKNQKVVLVDGAQGGQTAQVISVPSHPNYAGFWNTVNTRLGNSGVSANQVQVIWLKEANQAGNTPVQTYSDSLVVQFKRIANELHARFPNVKLCYMASRISARYATTGLNPEPYAYWTGWAIKKVIEDQVNGDAQLQYTGPNAKAPWLSWGLYMWSDGNIPQTTNPNIVWNCPADFQNDGTHPSQAGAQKVASLLLDFFTTDSTAVPWFLGTGCPASTAVNNAIEKTQGAFVVPNPFHDHATLTFENSAHEHFSLEIYNMQGWLVQSVAGVISNRIVVERQNLASGPYFFRLHGAGSYQSGKFMIR